MIRAIQLVQDAVVMIHHQHVTIAAACRPAFDRHIGWQRVSGMIALIVVLKRHLHFGLCAWHVNNGIPMGPPSQSPDPKSGCAGWPAPMVASYVFELGS